MVTRPRDRRSDHASYAEQADGGAPGDRDGCRRLVAPARGAEPRSDAGPEARRRPPANFVVSFPMVFRLDERAEEPWSLGRTAIDALAAGMLTFVMLDVATRLTGMP